MTRPTHHPKFPLVRVRWVDSTGPHGWTSLKHAIEITDLSIETIGWLIQTLDDRVTIASHIHMCDIDNPNVDGVMTIPRPAIVRMESIGDWQEGA